MTQPQQIESLTLKPIGFVSTPYKDRAHAPRQPHADKVVEGKIVLLPGQNFEQALQDLSGFELIWIISWFHKNKNWKPKVLPPRGERKRRGVFATRSPYRPNPIGLSVAELVEIRGRTLKIRGVDLLDGTPVLDIKPYIRDADSFPSARAGWLEEIIAAEASSKNSGEFNIQWTPLAREQSDWLNREHDIVLDETAERVLKRDPTPHPYRRVSAKANGEFEIAVKSWRLEFSLRDREVTILRVASGYPASEIIAAKKGKRLHDQAAHVAFHGKYNKT